MHFMCLKWSSLTHISTCFQDFGENFVDTTKETNRPEIFQVKSTSFLGNKSNKSNNETFFKCTSSMEVMKKKNLSPLSTLQHFWREAMMKLSVLGALSPFIVLSLWRTSSSVSRAKYTDLETNWYLRAFPMEVSRVQMIQIPPLPF